MKSKINQRQTNEENLVDDIMLDVEFLSISESTPEVSKNGSLVIVGCNGTYLFKNENEISSLNVALCWNCFKFPLE